MKRPKILIALSGFLPGTQFGGTVTSRVTLIQNLEQFFDFSIITLNHDYRQSTPYPSITTGWNSYGNHKILYLSDREHNQHTLEHILRTEQPALIYASGTITSYFQYNKPLLQAAKRLHIPVLITPDGDMCGHALRMKWPKKLAAIILCRIFNVFKGCHFQTTIHEETINLQHLLGVSADKITFLPNLPHVFKARQSYVKQQGKLKLVFSSRIHPKKNLLYALQILQKVNKPVQFDIYGPIEDRGYWVKCQQIIDTCPPHIQITYKGALPPEIAQRIYAYYDFSILPTSSENYGYAIEESLSCACPVVISCGTTPWDDVNGKAGYTVSLARPKLFIQQLEVLVDMTNKQYNALTRNIEAYLEQKLSYHALVNRYRELIVKLIQDRNASY